MAALAIRWLTMPKSRIFDRVRRTDMSRKKRTESSFANLNRSGRRGSAESRAYGNLVVAHSSIGAYRFLRAFPFR